MSRKDNIDYKVRDIVGKLNHTWGGGGKFLAQEDRDVFMGKCAVACDAFEAPTQVHMKSVFFRVLHTYTIGRKQKGYDCAKEMLMEVIEYDLPLFVKMIEPVFKRYFKATTHTNTAYKQGFHIKFSEVNAFAGALADVVCATDSPFFSEDDVAYFIFRQMQLFLSKKQSDDDLADAIARAMKQEYGKKKS